MIATAQDIARNERVRLSTLPAVWRIESEDGDVEEVAGVAYRFNAAAADRACEFFELFLTHTKAPWAGKPFILPKWQRMIVRRLFGWKAADGLRRYRTLFLFIPRKNGKSTFASALALYGLLADGEAGAEVYSAAADRDQAAMVFDQAKAMVESNDYLQSRCQCYRRTITQPETRSKYQVISSDAKKKHGFNTHMAIIDELHAHENRDLYDVLVTSMIARKQPLTIIMTTAGFDRNSICYEVYDYAKKVDDGTIEDPTFLPVVFEIDETDDWNDEATWFKANPNLGVSIEMNEFRGLYLKAKETPGFENTFKRLHLNIWTEQATRWLPMDTWRKCVGPERGPEWLRSMAGRELFAGVDLSSTTDLTALVGIFPDRKTGYFDAICRFWMPAKQVAIKSKMDNVRYDLWARDGYIELTEGSAVDQLAIEKAIYEWGEMYDLKDVAVDRWEASRLISNLEQEGVKAFAHGQGYASMSLPSKDLERVLVDEKLRHGAHPVLTWMAGNVAIMTDPSGNIKPAKDKSNGRIDGIVALVMALGRAMLRAPDERIVYVRRNRGLLSV